MTDTVKEGKNRTSAALLIILAAAALVRIVYLVQLGRSDIGEVLPLDMVFYRDLALGIISRGGFPAGVLTFNPLYPVFLVTVFSAFGSSPAVPRVIQSLIGIFTIYLVFLAGRELGRSSDRWKVDGERVGLAAALGALLYPQFILYEGSLLATSLVTFFLTAAFTLSLAIDRALRGEAPRGGLSARIPLWLRVLVLGVIIGAGALGRPNIFFLLAAAVPVWIAFRGESPGRGLRLAAVCLAGTVLMLLPPVVYNAAGSGRFVPVTAHGGINLYIGNNPSATGIYAPPEGMRSDMRGLVEDARRIAEENTGVPLADADVSEYWTGRAKEWMVTDPAGFARLLWRKFLLFWNGTEVSDIVELSFYRSECPVLHLPVLPFTVISMLALPGFCILFLIRKGRALSMIFLGSALASIMLFYINSRYRVPFVPVMIIMAALSAVWSWERIRARDWVPAACVALLAAVVFFLSAGRDMVRVNKSAAWTFLGNHYMQEGREEEGEKAFAEAFRLEPNIVMTRINYGRALLRRGKFEQSRELYSSAFGMDPDFPGLAVEYGSLLDQMGEREEAVRMFRYALSGSTRDRVLACQLLSRIAYSEGRSGEAIEWIRRALEILPGDERLLEILHNLEGSD